MARHRVLVIEDEEAISEPLAEALEREGFRPEVAGSVRAGLEAFRSGKPDIILLDVMLPDGDGRDVLREVRATSRVPVIMLTARGDETDRIVGLELGADDYITKPFSARELIARIRAVLRRASAAPASHSTATSIGGLTLDLSTRAVTKDGSALDLTLKEFELLRVLMEQAGSVVRREDLIDQVWDTNWFGPTKTLDVHISSLRKKLGDDPAHPRFIHTARGVGFRFASEEQLGE